MKLLIFIKFFLISCITCSAQKVYSVRYANQADVKVFVVDYKNQAEKTLYFVDYKNQADLKIYFVDYKNQAGWQNKSKQHLMY